MRQRREAGAFCLLLFFTNNALFKTPRLPSPRHLKCNVISNEAKTEPAKVWRNEKSFPFDNKLTQNIFDIPHTGRVVMNTDCEKKVSSVYVL